MGCLSETHKNLDIEKSYEEYLAGEISYLQFLDLLTIWFM